MINNVTLQKAGGRMIKFENTEVMGLEHAIRGMRNPMNSWDKSDSDYRLILCRRCDDCPTFLNETWDDCDDCVVKKITEEHDGFIIGPNDLDLMKRLRNAGTDHRKFMRMITVYVDITAPLYWWKEFDTYKVGTVANSCSTMHKIAEKEFTLEDFSHEHLADCESVSDDEYMLNDPFWNGYRGTPMDMLIFTIKMLNHWRNIYLESKSKRAWWQMIQLLPSSYNQKRTVMMNYEVLANIYKSRRNHKLDEWAEHTESTCPVNKNTICSNPKEFLLCEDCSVGKGFCDWIKTLPYSELITGEDE